MTTAHWLITYGSWCLAPFGLLGMVVVGRKLTWGWVVSMTTQGLWAVYAVGTGQYGFLLGTCSYFGVYLNNWVLWRTGRSLVDRLRRRPAQPAPVSPELAALRAVFADLDSTGRAGDEWAYEWMHEVWPALVPPDVRAAVGDTDAAELLDDAAQRVCDLLRAGRADDLLTAYSTHAQSCAYTDGIIDYVAENGSRMTAQEFARSLQEEAGK